MAELLTNKGGVKRATDRSAARIDERLGQVLSTFTTLRDDGKELLAQIHRSLLEMRQLRQQIRNQKLRIRSRSHEGGVAGRVAQLQKALGFTAREAQVAVLLSKGRSNLAIAKALGISTHTARHHTQRVLTKLRVHSR